MPQNALIHGDGGRCFVSTSKVGRSPYRRWSVSIIFQRGDPAEDDTKNYKAVRALYRTDLSNLGRIEAHRRTVHSLDTFLTHGVGIDAAIATTLEELEGEGIIETPVHLQPPQLHSRWRLLLLAGLKIFTLGGIAAAYALWHEAIQSPEAGVGWLWQPEKSVATLTVLFIAAVLWGNRLRIRPWSGAFLLQSCLVAGGASFAGTSVIGLASILAAKWLNQTPMTIFIPAGLLWLALAWVSAKPPTGTAG